MYGKNYFWKPKIFFFLQENKIQPVSFPNHFWLLVVGLLGTKFQWNLNSKSLKKISLKMLSAKCQPSRFGPTLLIRGPWVWRDCLLHPEWPHDQYLKGVIAAVMSGHTWWHHDMGTFSMLLAICEGNPPVTGGFPSQRASNKSVMFYLMLPKLLDKQSSCWWYSLQSFDVFFDVSWNKLLDKQSSCWCFFFFETFVFFLWC